MSYAPAVATIAASLFTALFTWILYGSNRRALQQVAEHSVLLKEIELRISEKALAFKEVERESVAAAKVADFLGTRYEALRAELAELMGLFDTHVRHWTRLIKERALYLCNSIAFHIVPSGTFDEEFNVQLMNVCLALTSEIESPSKLDTLYIVFKNNCWKLIKIENDRIQQSITKGQLLDRRAPEPFLQRHLER